MFETRNVLVTGLMIFNVSSWNGLMKTFFVRGRFEMTEKNWNLTMINSFTVKYYEGLPDKGSD
jgi:hypothetical protein